MKDESILSMPIELMDVSVRLRNCLKAAGCETVGDIVKHDKIHFLKLRNFGKRSLSELESFLDEHHLSFGTNTSSGECRQIREIEFRARTLATIPLWVYGTPVFFRDGGVEIYGTDIFQTGETRAVMMHTMVDPKTIGQFTSLTDKNGKEIYKGDILEYTEKYIDSDDIKRYVGDVVYRRGCFEFKMSSNGYILLGFIDKSQIEVIGNIFDNPELLQQ